MISRDLILFIVLALVVFTSNIWGTSIYILDEAKNASCAMEMYQRGDLIVPTFNGQLRTDKPPLHYYAMMIAYSIAGVSPFTARIFSGICGVLLVAIMYGAARRYISKKAATFTALVLVSSLQLAIQFHLAVPDPYLILLLSASFLLLYKGYSENHAKSMYLFYVTAALAFLTKGLVAIVFPALVFILFIVITQRSLAWESIRRLRLIPGSLLFLAIAAPWYIAVGYATDGAWLEGFFIQHNVERYTNTMEGHRGNVFAPFVIVCAALLPFSIFFIHAIRHTWRERLNNPFLIFSLIIVGVVVAFFSLSKTILPSYPAPALPFFAIILGTWLASYVDNFRKDTSATLALVIYMLIAVAIPIAVYFALEQDHVLTTLRSMAFYFTVLPVGALVALIFYFRNKIIICLYILGGSWIVTSLLFFFICFPRVDNLNPVVKALDSEPLRTSPVIFFRSYNPAFVFQFKQVTDVVEDERSVQQFLTKHPEGFVITYDKHLQHLGADSLYVVVFREQDLFERDKTVILRAAN